MNRLINKKAKTIAALGIAALAASGSAHAATTGSVQLEGTLAAVLEIAVSAASAASSIDLSVDASSGITVATVTEKSNSAGGYTVTVTSSNLSGGDCATAAPCLLGQDGDNDDELSYTISYDGVTVSSFTNGAATVTDTTIGQTAADRVNDGTSGKAVQISYDGSTSFLAADTYQDTLTFTIAAP